MYLSIYLFFSNLSIFPIKLSIWRIGHQVQHDICSETRLGRGGGGGLSPNRTAKTSEGTIHFCICSHLHLFSFLPFFLLFKFPLWQSGGGNCPICPPPHTLNTPPVPHTQGIYMYYIVYPSNSLLIYLSIWSNQAIYYSRLSNYLCIFTYLPI